jgi:hypothetical protein
MSIHSKEIMGPEELTQLGVVFDEAWASVSGTASEGNAELRTALASIVLRLAHLRQQLGPDQIKATALRIFRCEVMETPAPSSSPTSHFVNKATSHSASEAVAGPS